MPHYENHAGVRYLITTRVDVPVGKWVDGKLEPIPEVRYRHDGAGGVIMVGGLCRPSEPLGEMFQQHRLAGLEEKRAAAAAKEYAVPPPEWYEAILWSLVEAREQAGPFRARQDAESAGIRQLSDAKARKSDG